jgi:hypothetical protein
LQEQGLLYNQPQSLVHCTGAWNYELHLPEGDGKVTTADLWMYAMAQPLTTVSPEMYKEFELDHLQKLFSRFGLVYYGCCDPMEKKFKYVRDIPHLRKVSVSPWSVKASCAEQIGPDFVYSCKPNPALLAWDSLDEDAIRKDMKETIDLCTINKCPLEIIFKDISTVRYDPQRLDRVAKLAMDLVKG